MVFENQLLGLRSAGSLCSLGKLVGALVAANTTTPLPAVRGLIEVVGLGSADEGSKLSLVLGADVLDRGDGRGLLVHECPDASLALDNDVWHAHLAAEGGQEDNELNGVDVISNDNEVGLLGLDEGNNVVEAVLDEEGLLAVSLGVLLLAIGDVLGNSVQAGLLLLLRLGPVLVQELEESSGRVLVEGVAELGNRRGNLEALVKDNLLALEANVFGPLDEAGNIALGLDVLANTEVLGGALEARVLLHLAARLLAVGGRSGLLGSGLGGLRL